MPDDAHHNRTLLEKIGALSAPEIAEVEAFIDTLQDRAENAAWRKGAFLASQPILQRIWDNEDDAIYDEL
jgi:hypothetical protein